MVNSVDASMLLAAYARLSSNKNATFSEKARKAADVDENNKIDSVDASLVLAYYSYLSRSHGEKITDMREWLK